MKVTNDFGRIGIQTKLQSRLGKWYGESIMINLKKRKNNREGTDSRFGRIESNHYPVMHKTHENLEHKCKKDAYSATETYK